MSISDRLDEIAARADAATEGPWKIETHYGMSQSRRRQIVVPGWMTPIAVLGQENPYGDPDAEFIAASRTDVPELVEAVRRRDAALRAVLDLHEAVPVYQLRDEFGGFATNDDGERILITTLCRECSSEDAIESVEDQEWVEDWAPEVQHPCPTVLAVQAALGEVQP